jgi:predicted GNAT superfamily acetyltransferase
MRGANARLNLEKLGATVRDLTLDKYGVLRSDLYGNVPSDRFTAYWDLVAATTHGRLEDVRTERYLGPDPAMVRELPEITPDDAERLAETAPPAARYRIPADIDDLMSEDARRANVWRSEMRAALSPFMTIKSARAARTADAAPVEIGVDLRPGAYDVVAFATDVRAAGHRDNWYVLRRRGGEA